MIIKRVLKNYLRKKPYPDGGSQGGVELRSLLLALFVLCWPLLLFAQSITLTDFKGGSLNFTIPKSVKINYFLLNNPHRLVIDTNGVNVFDNQLKMSSLTSTPIRGIRSAILGNQVRIVFDLKQALEIEKVIHHKSNGPNDSLQFIVKNSLSHLPAVVLAPSEVIVVIDPGHGGKDPGAMGPHHLYEKDVVLDIAKKLQGLMNQQPGFKAILTRDNDYYLTLRQRLAIARKNKANMFIAIHADAYSNHDAHGVSVFALSNRGATSEAARWLAARENQSELMGGIDLPNKEDILRSVLINLSQNATIQTSLMIGKNLLENIHAFAHLHHTRIEQAAFVVLKSPDIPSLLVETGFISNKQEENNLNSQSYQQNLAQAIMLGIKKYYTAKANVYAKSQQSNVPAPG